MGRAATILILVAACTGDDAYRPLEAACAYEGEAPDFTTTLGCEPGIVIKQARPHPGRGQ